MAFIGVGGKNKKVSIREIKKPEAQVKKISWWQKFINLFKRGVK